jgi:hypothetical protein
MSIITVLFERDHERYEGVRRINIYALRIGSSCAKTWPMGLRGRAVIELEHAAEAVSASDGASSDERGLGRDAFIAQTLVRPFLMVMVDKRAEGRPEMSFAEWHHSRETLGLDGPDKSFGKRVQIRTWRQRIPNRAEAALKARAVVRPELVSGRFSRQSARVIQRVDA